MVSGIAKYLGEGIYTPAEAAFYARERTQTVVRWVLGDETHEPVIVGQFDPHDRVISFLDFVQMLAISAIRRQHGVPLQTIRRGVEHARTKYQIKYPFAMRHKTFLFQRSERTDRDHRADDDEKERRFEILIDVDGSLVQMTGRNRDNRVMKEIVELYIADLHFGPNGLAECYDAYRSDGLAVTMNPKRRFGEPLLPSGYTAETLYEAVSAEGSIDLAAKAYGVDRREVELACKYFDHLLVRPPRE